VQSVVGYRAALRELTAGFAVQLREHFSAEEADGNFGEIRRQRPDLVEVIDLRKLEHDQMRTILDDLDGSGRRMDVPDLATVVIALLHILERHEAEESALMRHFVAWSQSR
jgi:hemerythrin